MAAKREREDDPDRPAKKPKKGFSIGPSNLPDGAHKRKVQKIKKDLIHKAKIKKQYAKFKAREIRDDRAEPKSMYDGKAAEPVPEPSLDPHPDRLRMMGEQAQESESERCTGRKRRPVRSQPFMKETEVARMKKEAMQAEQRRKNEAHEERSKKLAEREWARKTMAKARGGPNGQRKLGRESLALLAKAQRLVKNE